MSIRQIFCSFLILYLNVALFSGCSSHEFTEHPRARHLAEHKKQVTYRKDTKKASLPKSFDTDLTENLPPEEEDTEFEDEKFYKEVIEDAIQRSNAKLKKNNDQYFIDQGYRKIESQNSSEIMAQIYKETYRNREESKNDSKLKKRLQSLLKEVEQYNRKKMNDILGYKNHLEKYRSLLNKNYTDQKISLADFHKTKVELESINQEIKFYKKIVDKLKLRLRDTKRKLKMIFFEKRDYVVVYAKIGWTSEQMIEQKISVDTGNRKAKDLAKKKALEYMGQVFIKEFSKIKNSVLVEDHVELRIEGKVHADTAGIPINKRENFNKKLIAYFHYFGFFITSPKKGDVKKKAESINCHDYQAEIIEIKDLSRYKGLLNEEKLSYLHTLVDQMLTFRKSEKTWYDQEVKTTKKEIWKYQNEITRIQRLIKEKKKEEKAKEARLTDLKNGEKRLKIQAISIKKSIKEVWISIISHTIHRDFIYVERFLTKQLEGDMSVPRAKELLIKEVYKKAEGEVAYKVISSIERMKNYIYVDAKILEKDIPLRLRHYKLIGWPDIEGIQDRIVQGVYIAFRFTTDASILKELLSKNINEKTVSNRLRKEGKVNKPKNFRATEKSKEPNESKACKKTGKSQKPIVSISSYDTEDPCEVGKQTIYIIECKNEGSVVAKNLVLRNQIPKEMEYMTAKAPVAHKYKDGMVIFEPAILEPGKILTYVIICKAMTSASAKNVSILMYDGLNKPILDEEGTSIYR